MDQARARRRPRWGHGPTARITIICGAMALYGAHAASAGDARFGVDCARDLAELARTGRVAISIERLGGVYTLDASAVLPVDAQRLLRVS
jgi:hypothetical protein